MSDVKLYKSVDDLARLDAHIRKERPVDTWGLILLTPFNLERDSRNEGYIIDSPAFSAKKLVPVKSIGRPRIFVMPSEAPSSLVRSAIEYHHPDFSNAFVPGDYFKFGSSLTIDPKAMFSKNLGDIGPYSVLAVNYFQLKEVDYLKYKDKIQPLRIYPFS